MSNKQKLTKKISKEIIEYFNSKIDTFKDEISDITGDFLNVHIHSEEDGEDHHEEDKEIKKNIEEFVNKELEEIADSVFSENIKEAEEIISKELDLLIDGLLSEEEAKEALDFISTPVGSKILRNLDIFRDSYLKGDSFVFDKIAEKWNSDETFEKINNYINENFEELSLEEGEIQDEDTDDDEKIDDDEENPNNFY